MKVNLKDLDLYITVLIFFKKIYYIVKSLSFLFKKSKKYLEKKEKYNNFNINSLIYCPEYIFSNHFEASIKLSNLLNKFSNIFMPYCNNSFEQCMYKLNRNVNWRFDLKFFKDKQESIDCFKCSGNIHNSDEIKGINFIHLDHLANLQLKNELSKVQGMQLDELKNYSYEGTTLFKQVLYDYFIIFKKDKLCNISTHEFNIIKNQIISNIQSIFYLKRIHEKYKLNFLFLIDEYSFQSSVRDWGLRNNIKVFFYQYAYSKEKILEITDVRTWPERILDYKNKWDIWKLVPLNNKVIFDVYDDLIGRILAKGNHVFSKKFMKKKSNKILEKLKIDKSKITIGLFHSSDDEQVAISQNVDFFGVKINNHDIFESQEDWIDKTIEFVEESTKFQLIIVIHPRMFKSLKSPRTSSNFYSLYEKYNTKKFKNIRFIWPEDFISTYNVIEIIDYATVAWSSIGIEIALLGIPVVTGIEKNYIITPNFTGIKKVNSLDQYFSFFKKDITYSTETLKESLRWYNLLTYGSSLHLQFNISNEDFKKVIFDNKKIVEFNTEKLSSRVQKSKETEEEAIRRSLTKLIASLGLEGNDSKLLKNLTNLVNDFH
jgi:hypothetical protein